MHECSESEVRKPVLSHIHSPVANYLVLAHEVLNIETRRETACAEDGVFLEGQAVIGHHARHGG